MATERERPDNQSLRRAIAPNRAGLASKTLGGSTLPYVLGTTAQKILPENKRRGYLLVQNRSAVTVYLAFGVSIDSSLNTGIEIAPGGNYEPTIVLVSDVYMVSSATGALISVTEGIWRE